MVTSTSEDTQVLRIEGMHCAACVRRVERALTKVDGVASASADFIVGRAVVELSAEVAPEQINAAISGAGYELIADADVAESDVSGIQPQLWRAGLALALGWGIFLAMQINRWADIGWDSDVVFPVLFVVATPTLGWTIWPMLHRAAVTTARRTADMDSLIVLGAGAAWIYSVVSTFAPSTLDANEAFYDTALIIVGFVSLGRALEARVRLRTASALSHLLEVAPQTARVILPDGERDIAASGVVVGDLLRVRPGEQAPVDGVLVEGSSAIDESLLSGESLPVSKSSGDPIYAGTINIEGSFSYRATQVGSATALARITASVERAQSSKAPIQRLADQIASVFVPFVAIVAALTLVVWIAVEPDDWTGATLSAVAVLVVACPCALGLATPAAIAAASGRAARLGILFRDAEALEAAGRIDTVAWDKTGTLTSGRHEVVAVTAFIGSERELVRLAAAVEQQSEHPIGQAIVAYADDLGVELPAVSEYRAHPGRGAVGAVGERRVAVGSERLMTELGVDMISAVVAPSDARSTVYVALNDELTGAFELRDQVKPAAAEAIALLDRRGIGSALISGDQATVAEAVARDVGIADVHAPVLPEQKAELVAALQSDGRRVAMVGDGINDAPAMAQAELGLAMRSGSDLALETAQVALMRSNPLRAAEAILLARSARAVIRQNLGFAFSYNLLLIPIAAGLAVPIFDAVGGVPGGLVWLFGESGRFEPIAAALAMVASSLSVLTNALRLTRWSAGGL